MDHANIMCSSLVSRAVHVEINGDKTFVTLVPDAPAGLRQWTVPFVPGSEHPAGAEQILADAMVLRVSSADNLR